ncbi:MAG: carboxypeptidase-like regulatory domain-containing protein, partial [Acidobacteriota bacterium]
MKPSHHRSPHFPRVASVALWAALSSTGWAAAQPVELHGRVTDLTGAGLPGATLALRAADAPAPGPRSLPAESQLPVAATASSTADGSFVLEAPTTGWWQLQVTHPELADGLWQLAPVLEPGHIGTFRLAPDSQRAACETDSASCETLRSAQTAAGAAETPGPITRGKIVDLDGQPIAGALIWSGERRATGAEDGTFELSLEPESSALSLAAAGYRSITFERSQLAMLDEPIVLEPKPVYVGRVLDPSGQALPDAEVDLLLDEAADQRDSPNDHNALGSRVGREGFFRIAATASRRPHRLQIHQLGYRPVTVTAPPLIPGQSPPLLTLVLEPELQAFGTVLDTGERPIEGAEVRIIPEAPISGRDTTKPERWSATTDSEGSFTLQALQPGSVSLTVLAEGYAALEIPGITVDAERRPVDLGTVLLEPGLWRDGWVVDTREQPIEGVRVSWSTTAAASDRGETKTDGAGAFRLADLAPSALLELRLEHPSFQSAIYSDLAPGGEPLVLTLIDAAGLNGTVLDPDRQPVTGADVSLAPAAIHGATTPSAVTDHDGAFAFDSLVPGTYLVSVRSSAGALAPTRVELTAGVKDALELILQPAATLSGAVRSGVGEPVEGAEIVVELMAGSRAEPGAERLGWGREQAQSNAAGRFAMPGLTAGSYALVVRHPEYQPLEQTLELDPLAAGELELILERRSQRYPVRGRVSDDTGRGVGGVNLRLLADGRRPLEATTSFADGSFELMAPQIGSYTVRAEHERYAVVTSPPLELGPQGLDGVVIELHGGATVSGVIHGPTLEELGQIQVVAERLGEPTRAGVLRPDGSYRVTGLSPGSWTLRAAGPRQRAAEQIEIHHPGDSVHLDLDLTGGLRLSGSVVAGDQPVAGALLTVLCPADGFLASSRSDPSGRFRVDGLPADTCQLDVRDPSGVDTRREVVMSEDRDLLIEIERTVVEGRVLSAASGEPLVGAQLELIANDQGYAVRRRAHTDGSGHFALPPLPVGSWTLRAVADGHLTTETPLPATLDAPLEIRLEPAAPLILQLQTDYGQVPSRVMITVAAGQASPRQMSYRPDPTGQVLLHGLPNGRASLRIVDSNGRSAALEVEVPAEAVRVVLSSVEPEDSSVDRIPEQCP